MKSPALTWPGTRLSRLAGAYLIGVAACGSANTNEGAASATSSTASPAKPGESTMKDEPVTTPERAVSDMEAALSRKDLEGLVALFAPDATIESYLVSRVFNRSEGICRGRDEIRQLVRTLLERGVPWGGHRPPIIRGNTVAVEFLTASSDQETYSVDIIEVRDGKIQSLRAYVGWRALEAPPAVARD
jgi:ketosteroid isomerase-like protein